MSLLTTKSKVSLLSSRSEVVDKPIYWLVSQRQPGRATCGCAPRWTWCRRIHPIKRGRAMRSALGDVGLQLVLRLLQLSDSALHDVADADDPDQPPVGDDGHVAEAPFGHDDREAVHGVRRGAGEDLGGHDLRHG